MTNEEQSQALIKDLIDLSLLEIPGVGAIVSRVADLIWSSQIDGNNEQYQNMIKVVETYVDMAIMNSKISTIKGNMKAFSREMYNYGVAKTQSERSGKMSSLLALGLTIKESLIDVSDAPNDIQLIPLTAAFIPLHMTVLKEQYKNGKEIYGSDADQDNWANQLKYNIKGYNDYFTASYEKFKAWRKGFLVYHPVSEFRWKSMQHQVTANMSDNLKNHKSVYWSWQEDEDTGLFGDYCFGTINYLLTSWEVNLSNQLLPFFKIQSYLPKNITSGTTVNGLPMDALQDISLYPVNPMTIQFYQFGTQYIENPPGFGVWTQDKNPSFSKLKEINVFRNTKQVVGIQAVYDGFTGTVIGQKTNNVQSVDVSTKKLTSLQFKWNVFGTNTGQDNLKQSEITDIGFLFEDKTSVNPLSGSDVYPVAVPLFYDIFLINGTVNSGSIQELAFGYKCKYPTLPEITL
ncbi:MAG: insecticidal delta-endotoxin Cry8Ea1 family protein [Flavobacteriales bacterium]|nr:insecticidal delta-endotoxin Cry8Ea1 family protein [Flavobacteriales bacterium]